MNRQILLPEKLYVFEEQIGLPEKLLQPLLLESKEQIFGKIISVAASEVLILWFISLDDLAS